MEPMNSDANADSSDRKGGGLHLTLALLAGFRAMVDALHADLAERGHPEARPLHGFALQALGPSGTTVAELGRRLGVSKQAAAKTVAGLERFGYVERSPHPSDARAVIVRRALRGEEMLELSSASFDRIRLKLEKELGVEQVAAIETGLSRLGSGTSGTGVEDLPGWIR
jgi:DNA-binding MarR family transcriptional regulator